jgi:hypothetical protein
VRKLPSIVTDKGKRELKRMHQERWREPSDDDEHSLYAVALRAAVIFAAIDSPIALPFISRYPTPRKRQTAE